MRRAAVLLAGAGAIVIAVTMSAASQEPPFDKSVLPKLFEEIDRRSTPNEYFQQCPADIWRKAVSVGDQFFSMPSIDYASCAKDVLACTKLCFDSRSSDACFETARIIQQSAPKDEQSKAEAMFAQACAAGSAGGCTNRGAGILQDQPPDKLRRDSDGRKLCTYRTFKLSCDTSDAWGCTMYGMALQYGEGIPANEADAMAAYKKSCEIDGDFDACRYAKALMKTLENR
jgi:TPR repeat protein